MNQSLIGTAARAGDVMDAVLDLANEERTDDDLILFYFSGHGSPLTLEDESKAIFLVTSDFDEEKAPQNPGRYLSLTWLWHHLVIILDCCYAGNFVGVSDDPLRPDLRKAVNQLIEEEPTGQGLKNRLRAVLTAGGVNETAIERDGHGAMTRFIIEAVRGDHQEACQSDGTVELEGLGRFLQAKLHQQGIVQTPLLQGQLTRHCILAWHQQRSQEAQEQRRREHEQERETRRREQAIRACLHDHSGFIRERLDGFVGRTQELEEVRERIEGLHATGGYMTITGQAGQGKSSMIARIVQDAIDWQGEQAVVYHFVPFSPGPDHQIGLLRNLIARLLRKHNLPDIYIASDSRAALRDYLVRALHDVVEQGEQEVIYLDGLDQLEEDLNGVRDLSFLPPKPPAGVVFVLGTRPNDTLKPLELRSPHSEYPLPNLSRADFDLVLQRRGVALDSELVDRFYTAMEQNALYLDLVARELAQPGEQHPEAIIQRLADDPNNLFTLTMDRLKRNAQNWREVLKPILGLLLAAREPLGQHIVRALIKQDGETTREGLQRLGGLLARDGEGRYTLYHLKLRDYLREDEQRSNKAYVFAADEEQEWHQRLADWCAGGSGGLVPIWNDEGVTALEQDRRVYARQHYVAHLYAAKAWGQLTTLLDTSDYLQAKWRYDPSGRSLVQDLDLGRRMAAREEGTFVEQRDRLPQLWRYSLLRGSIATQADNIPTSCFIVRVLVGQTRAAVEWAEVLTNPMEKATTFVEMGVALLRQKDEDLLAQQFFQRAREIVRTRDEPRQQVLGFVAVAKHFLEHNMLAEASRLVEEALRIHTTTPDMVPPDAMRGIVEVLASSQHWEQAEMLARTIEDTKGRAEALGALAQALASSQQWQQAEHVAHTIEDAYERAKALRALAQMLAASQQWQQAERVARVIEDAYERAGALEVLAQALASSQLWPLLLQVTQQSWLTATTRDYILPLLDMASGLIQQHPTLGTALAEQFHWVDAFLKGEAVLPVVAAVKEGW